MALSIVDLFSGSLSYILSLGFMLFIAELIRPSVRTNKVLLILLVLCAAVFLGAVFYYTHYLEKTGIAGFWIGYAIGFIGGAIELVIRINPKRHKKNEYAEK